MPIVLVVRWSPFYRCEEHIKFK